MGQLLLDQQVELVLETLQALGLGLDGVHFLNKLRLHSLQAHGLVSGFDGNKLTKRVDQSTGKVDGPT